ncbi:hypothetical protein CGMCC3_g2133 [Colletotrichum fructicola]|nr:uncharacterized protein CGMCC3_g2133 [Colletotrichum fructicola]KAE9581928.1 hypothetical protein CGMCC3_g2133 [Colletotrichum fructicola]
MDHLESFKWPFKITISVQKSLIYVSANQKRQFAHEVKLNGHG